MDIRQQRRKGRPYVIVFCGVNGVGKSTNLAKITYWLGQHGIKVGAGVLQAAGADTQLCCLSWPRIIYQAVAQAHAG